METEKKQIHEWNVFEEMNLAEFPITSLTTQRHFKPIYCTDTVLENGIEIKREWRVDGSLTLGTPIAIDEMVFMILLSMVENGFVIPPFSTYQFCKQARWPLDGRYYKIFQDSMMRLAHATVLATNSFYDKDNNKHFSKKVFHIFDELRIHGMEPTGNNDVDKFIWDRDENSVVLSKTILESMRAGNVKPTRLDLYMALRLPVAKRLYRYLDKKFYGANFLKMSVSNLGVEHVGLSRSYNAAQIKRELDKGFTELKRSGYLAGWEYQSNGVVFLKKTGKAVVLEVFAKEDAALKNGQINSAQDLVRLMHGAFGIKRGWNKLEMDQAQSLMQRLGFDVAKAMVEFAVADLKNSGASAKMFGIVLQYESGYLKAEEERKKKAESERAKEQEKLAQVKAKEAQEMMEKEQRAKFEFVLQEMSKDKLNAFRQAAEKRIRERVVLEQEKEAKEMGYVEDKERIERSVAKQLKACLTDWWVKEEMFEIFSEYSSTVTEGLA